MHKTWVGVSLVGWSLVTGLWATGASGAETQLELGDVAIVNRHLSLGAVSVVVNYQPSDFGTLDEEETNLTLQLIYDGAVQLTHTDTVWMVADVTLQDLDSNGTAEVIFQTYTGGAHCCMAITTYTWQQDAFKAIPFGYLDGGGGQFQDLNGDGLTEFVSLDNAFFYAFSSYAESYPPDLILTFENGAYTDTTAEFEPYLRSHAWNMFQAMESYRDRPDPLGINGLLAGYVAQKIRLGEYQQGWDLMLARYDRRDDWGLARYNEAGEEVGRYPNFPAALRGFLTAAGYLDDQGNPQPRVDRFPYGRPD